MSSVNSIQLFGEQLQGLTAPMFNTSGFLYFVDRVWVTIERVKTIILLTIVLFGVVGVICSATGLKQKESFDGMLTGARRKLGQMATKALLLK